MKAYKVGLMALEINKNSELEGKGPHYSIDL